MKYKLHITDRLGDYSDLEADRYEIRGNLVYVYNTIRAEEGNLAQLDTEILRGVYEFIAMEIEKNVTKE